VSHPITGRSGEINSRNDRSLANQEIDILKKLDPNGAEAHQLSEVIQSRIARWHWRASESRRLVLYGVVCFYIALLAVYLGVYMSEPETLNRKAVVFILSVVGSVFYAFSLYLIIRGSRMLRKERRSREGKVRSGPDLAS
jgi:hypothetical protein